MTDTAPTPDERPAYSAKPAAPVRDIPVRATPVSGNSGRVIGLALLSLVLSGGALGGAGYLWWQQQQLLIAQQTRNNDLEASLYSATSQIGQATKQIEQQAGAHKRLQAQVEDITSHRDLLQQKVDLVDQRIVEMLQGTARIDWMLAEVVHLVTVAERRLSLLGDVRGALSLLEAAEPVVKAMEEPQARALRQALIDDIQNLRSAEAEVIDTEGLLLRINSTKQRVQALQPPRPTFRAEPVVVPENTVVAQEGFDLFWYKVKTFLASLVRFQKNKEPLANVAVDPQARFYLQQSILLLLDQAQLAVLRGEPSTYTLSLQETTDRVQRYLRVDTQEGERVVRELKELAQHPVKQTVPNISGSLLALDAFRQAWDKGRSSREGAAARLQSAAQADPTPTASIPAAAPATPTAPLVAPTAPAANSTPEANRAASPTQTGADNNAEGRLP